MATQVREFAERVLLGSTLADKLWDPGPLVDDHPGPTWRGPRVPGRAPHLSISNQAAAFVRDVELADPGARGRALHFFANHELLALELMALALLRFVDAPPAFRRGLVSTLRDEQRHLGLYLGRMAELGTELGELPLGGFFWRTMAELDEPAGFVAHMSLTFEQANLDHAAHYMKVFAGHGDVATAQVLETVYEDEIRHVGFGLHWFRRWQPEPDLPDLPNLIEAHRAALVAPVTLRRARGRVFEREGRRRAGLPDDYLDAIHNLPAARGRAPVVHLFDPCIELELGLAGGYTPGPAIRARIHDLEALPLFFARPDDVVLVRELPRDDFLASLREVGIELPEFVATDLDASTIDVPDLPELAQVQPWGWTPRLARRLAPLRSRASDDPAPAHGWPGEILSKARGVAVLERVLASASQDPRLDDPAQVGVITRSLDATLARVAALHDAGYAAAVCKARFGAAGRGSVRVHEGPLPAPQRGWIERTLARQGLLVVEPWLDRCCDLSVRLHIDAPGQARIDGVGRGLIDSRGQYRGAVIGRLTAGLEPELARFLHGDGRDPTWLPGVWDRVAAEVAAELRPSGYVGPVCVDAFVHRLPDGSLRLRPVVEINPRMHMDLVALALERVVARGSVGLWRLVPLTELPPNFVSELPALEIRPQGIRAGVLATNDPSRAEAVIGLLAVAGTLAEAEAMLQPGYRRGP